MVGNDVKLGLLRYVSIHEKNRMNGRYEDYCLENKGDMKVSLLD